MKNFNLVLKSQKWLKLTSGSTTTPSRVVMLRAFAGHPAPDEDFIFSLALLCKAHPEVFGFPIKFIPAQLLSGEEMAEMQNQGILPIDVGGYQTNGDGCYGIFDHHGRPDQPAVSSTQKVADWLGWSEKPWLKPLLAWINAQDRFGQNFNLRIVNGESISAHYLLFSNIVRGSSQVRYNSMTVKPSWEEQNEATWALVAQALYLIRHFKRVNGNPTQIDPEAILLLQRSLGLAMRAELNRTFEGYNLAIPYLDQDFEGIISNLNAQLKKVHCLAPDEEDDYDYDVRGGVTFEPFVRIMLSLEHLKMDDPLAINFTLLALAQELNLSKKLNPFQKLEILADCWYSAFRLYGDWLEASASLRNDVFCQENGEAGQVAKRCKCGKWLVLSVKSDHAQLGKVSRHRSKRKDWAAAVTIQRLSSGNVLITCSNRDNQLQNRMQEVAFRLRKREAKKLGLNLTEDKLRTINLLVANWYLADFGGIFNGSLKNPSVPATVLALNKIFKIVCEILS